MVADYPEEFVIVVSLLFAGEIIVGTLLNLYVTVKWIKDRHGRTKSKNGNNFIAALKVIDLIICVIVIPVSLATLIVDRRSNTVVCFLKEGFVVFASSGSCVGVLLISFDRYCAVVLPTRKVFTHERVRGCQICIVAVSIIGLILPSLCLLMGNFETGSALSKQALPCRHVIWVFQENYVYDVYYIVLFTVAVICVFLCYRSVLQVVRRRLTMRTLHMTSTSTTSDKEARAFRFRRQEYKATRLAFAVVLTFLVCWGPHLILTIVQMTSPSSKVFDMIQTGCLVVAYLTPIIHPVIYSHETVDRSTTNLSKTSRFPLLKSLFSRRSVKVTPEHRNVDMSLEQSSSCAHITIHHSSTIPVPNSSINIAEFSV